MNAENQEPVPTLFGVGRRHSGSSSDDDDLLREVRPRGSAARPTLRGHGTRPSGAGRGVAWRGLRGPADVQRALRRLRPHGLQARRKGLREEQRARWVRCSASPRTTRSFRRIPNGAQPLSPTSSGAPGSRSRTRSRAPIRRPTWRCPDGGGSSTPRPARESRRSPSRHDTSKKRTSRTRRAGQLRAAHQTALP